MYIFFIGKGKTLFYRGCVSGVVSSYSRSLAFRRPYTKGHELNFANNSEGTKLTMGIRNFILQRSQI
jgi:hypothetical protein